MGKKIGVIGDGGWGTALAIHLAKLGHQVTLWSAFKEYVDVIKEKHENVKFLPGIKIPEEVVVTADLKEAVEPSEMIIFAVPTQYARLVLEKLIGFNFLEKIFVSVTKGIENETLLRMSEVVHEVLGEIPFVVLSGPTHAEEVASGFPSSIVASSKDLKLAEKVQQDFMGPSFRVYTNSDLVGVELGGSLKNVIAIAAGVSDGLGLGDNSKAALITRGIAEMMALGKALGADPQTFAGLSGIGDLITTCISSHSRNRSLGERLSSGQDLKQVLSSTEMVAEGVKTTHSAFQLAKKYKVQMPIVEGVHAVLYEAKDPKVILNNLMSRKPKCETVE